MKIFALSLFVFAAGLSAHAATGSETVTIERSRAVYPLHVELNQSTVRCLVGDYGGSSLKISLPAEEVRYMTIFRQTTKGETAPCINAGLCKFQKAPDGRVLDPSIVLDAAKPAEDIQLTVVLDEILEIDHDNKTCERSLSETISSTVRNIPFRHEDGGALGKLDYELCVRMKP